MVGGELTCQLGLGAFGDDFEHCSDRFGEFLAISGTGAFQPTDGTNFPDYLIARGAETILVVGDVTVALAIDAVVSECRKGKVPALTLMPNDVKRGALAGAGADFYAVGRQMGQLGTRVMRGEDTTTIPISYELPKYYAFNLTVLPSLKDSWIIPAPLLAAAKIVVK